MLSSSPPNVEHGSSRPPLAQPNERTALNTFASANETSILEPCGTVKSLWGILWHDYLEMNKFYRTTLGKGDRTAVRLIQRLCCTDLTEMSSIEQLFNAASESG